MLRIILGIAFIMAFFRISFSVLAHMHMAPKKSKPGCVRIRALYPAVGGVCAVVFGGAIFIMFTTHSNRTNFGLAPCLGIAFIGSIAMVWQWISQRIWYDETSFAVRNFWMVKRKYSYKDITGIFRTSQVYIIVGNTKIVVDPAMAGGNEFVRAVRRGYAKANNGEDISRATRLPRDAFNGNIADAGGYIVVGILVVTLFGGIFASFYLPPSEMMSEYFEAPVKDVSVGTEDMTFYLINQEEPFVIKDFRNYAQNINLLWETVGNSQKLLVNAEYKPGYRTADGHYRVCSMSDENGTVYVTFDMVWQQERGLRIEMAIVFGGFLAFLAMFAVGRVISGRNPEKHKLLYKLCFSQKGKH